jgi:hypothetical protein
MRFTATYKPILRYIYLYGTLTTIIFQHQHMLRNHHILNYNYNMYSVCMIVNYNHTNTIHMQ